MRYECVHKNVEKLYSVGIDHDSGAYLLEIVVTWIAWYSRFYTITREEFEGYERDPGSLDSLVDELLALSSPTASSRFFYSQRTGEEPPGPGKSGQPIRFVGP